MPLLPIHPPKGIDVGAPNTIDVFPDVPVVSNSEGGFSVNAGEGLNLVIDNYFKNTVYTRDWMHF